MILMITYVMARLLIEIYYTVLRIFLTGVAMKKQTIIQIKEIFSYSLPT